MTEHAHRWYETGVRRKHVDGSVEFGFKYGNQVVTYLRCSWCGQTGFRRPGSRVIYTWRLS